MSLTRTDASMDDIFSALTASQQDAVRHVDGPLLMLAGPGSGKTRVVTHRIAYMLGQGVPDRQIVALTFTNKSAEEMRLRLERLVPNARVWTGTFHRFCSRLLRRYATLVGLRENYSVYDTENARLLLKEACRDAGVELSHTPIARVMTAISGAKSELALPDTFRPPIGDPDAAIAANVYPHYQRRLLNANAVDFDDLLLHVAVLLRENPELRQTLDERYRYLLVDEFQDTNLAQYVIVRALAVDYPNLAATGDPDQSIYGWRGASVRNITEFERDFPDVRIIRLEQNFRSTKSILRAADHLIANNVRRKEKQLYTDNREGVPVRLARYDSGRAEADTVVARIANDVAGGRRRPRDFAIFYRTNALSRSLEQALRAAALPYQIVRGLEFYRRKEVKDVLAYLQLLNNPDDDAALLRIINTPPRRIGKTTVARLSQHSRRYDLPLLRAARESGLIESLSKQAAVHVAKFVATYDQMQTLVNEAVHHATQQVLELTGYQQWLESHDSVEAQQRLDNVNELLSDAHEFDETHAEDGGLEAFLEQASLVADVDAWATEVDRVTLMTLHAAKGLEFPVVYIVAVEDKVLPHERSRDKPDQFEEERRLLFVGMTRAEEELQLSFVRRRGSQGGDPRPVAPSPFLLELPHAEVELIGLECFPPAVEYDPAYEWDRDWDEFQPDEPPDQPAQRAAKRRPQRAKPQSMGATMLTADQMLASAGEATNRPSPEDFKIGMIVKHPQYGLGRIVSQEGSGRRKMVRVQFVEDEQPKTLSVIHSPLQPIR